jgi:hypothetical protein
VLPVRSLAGVRDGLPEVRLMLAGERETLLAMKGSLGVVLRERCRAEHSNYRKVREEVSLFFICA